MTDADAYYYDAQWSPDGSKIVFTSDRTGDEEIFVMNADGSSVANLTNHSASDSVAQWSPDGSRILFISDRDDYDFEVYVMNANGSLPANLSNAVGFDWKAKWSPDGSKIALESFRDFNYEIYVMKADGTGAVNVSDNPGGDEFNARWSPTGAKVAFESMGASDFEVFSVSADGSSLVDLTNNAANDFDPRWTSSGGPTPEPGGEATAEELLIDLLSDVEALPSAGVNSGQATALANQLESALRSLQGTGPASACDKIEQFIKDVDKKSPRFITFPVRDELIEKAEAILVALGCAA